MKKITDKLYGRFPTVFVLVSILLFAACEEEKKDSCPAGDEGCECLDGGICKEGLECERQWDADDVSGESAEWTVVEECVPESGQ